MPETFAKQVARFTDGDVPGRLLHEFRIASSVLCRSVMAPPWGFSVDARDAGSFHLLLAGDGWLEADGAEEPIRLHRGDVVVLPRGNGHRVTDSRTSDAPRLSAILQKSPVVDGELRLGAEATPTGEIVCGTFTVEGGRPPWFAQLPPVVVSAAKPGNGHWRDALAHALRDEARLPTLGGAAVVNRWLESLLGDALRTGIANGDARPVADERIGRVLALVNERPADPWRLKTLSDAAAMSRSAFAERFRALVGEPPGAYVTRVRLDRARRLLQSTDATVADIAARVGYGSEESLSRAFKSRFGEAPSVMRRAGFIGATLLDPG
jgi:AraC-like DNA-binding protein